MERRLFYFSLCFLLFGGELFAQGGVWNWPDDKATAQEKKVLYTDSMAHGNYLSAVEPLEWLITNVPDLNPAIYIQGATIYQRLVEETTDETAKEAYKRRTLEMFDLRTQYFGDGKNVFNRKALAAYNLYKNDSTQYTMLLQLFRKTIALNQADVITYNLLAYMDILQREKKQTGNITEEDVIEAYMQVKDIIAVQAQEEQSPRFQKIIDGIDKIFVGTVKVNCDFVHEKWAPRLTANNAQVAKYVVNFLLIADCTDARDNFLFLRAGKILYKGDPTLAVAKAIAKRGMLAKDYAVAIFYYKKALEGVPEDDVKGLSNTRMGLARAYAGASQKAKARQQASLASRYEPNAQDAYNLIGSLYLSSYQECKRGVSKVEDKAIYFAAYEMFKRAQNTKMMGVCEQQFPTIADMFELGKTVGDTVDVSCWFDERVMLRSPPAK